MDVLKVPMQVVDAETGEVKEERTADFHITPAAPGCCPECNYQHAPDEPHNRDMLHYQYTFYARHGRWPTWADAVAHCTPEVQTAWREELKRRGAWTEPGAADADGEQGTRGPRPSGPMHGADAPGGEKSCN